MSEALRTAFASFASGNPSGMAPGATTNAFAATVDAPSGARAASSRLCSLTMPTRPTANALTLTATALKRICLEVFGITSSLKERLSLVRIEYPTITVLIGQQDFDDRAPFIVKITGGRRL